MEEMVQCWAGPFDGWVFGQVPDEAGDGYNIVSAWTVDIDRQTGMDSLKRMPNEAVSITDLTNGAVEMACSTHRAAYRLVQVDTGAKRWDYCPPVAA